MMKCTICGGHTLPGAKLCLPCRSALRRARDDTISELLPLPRRVEAMAIGGAERRTQSLDVRTAQAKRVHGSSAPKSARHTSRFATAAVAFSVLAIGALAYGFGQQLRQDPQTIIAERFAQPPAHPRSSISPSTMAAEAWRTTELAPLPDVMEATVPSAPETAAPTEAPKPRKPAARAPKVVAAPVFEPPLAPAIVAVSPEPVVEAPAPVVVPDRWQSLSSALARCNGQNPFARIGCEHTARAQFCNGHWGQVAQCPAGIPNDHGQ